MPKFVKCPNCQLPTDHFDVIGEDPAQHCPNCGAVLTDEQIQSAEVVANPEVSAASIDQPSN